jgi:hypothetical protein
MLDTKIAIIVHKTKLQLIFSFIFEVHKKEQKILHK